MGPQSVISRAVDGHSEIWDSMGCSADTILN